MSKENTVSGLLSKMVKFVRNPATNWSDLDNREADRDAALSKQLLKEMIERKRRNDFVRKREFDMLRKMRKRETMVGQDPGGRPSFFQSSMPSKLNDRANTLKKIDEIEAQMSMQWWKTKHANSVLDFDNSTVFPISKLSPASEPLIGNSLPAGYGVTEPCSLQLAAGGAIKNVPVPASQQESAAGVAGAKPASPAPHRPMVISSEAASAVTRPAIGGLSGLGGSYEADATGFTPSRMVAMDVSEIGADAELEEAAIDFANGDDASAEAGLLRMLAPNGLRAGLLDTWMALFDLYRATGQQDKFETSAIQFVQHFDRSAPQWFSTPELINRLTTYEGKGAANALAADWICPSVVGIQTVAALKVALGKAAMPWRLDWRNLKTIDALALESLCKVFSSWATQPVQLRFIGEDQLQQVLLERTPTGQRDTAQGWWQLRMEMLRVTHRQEEFELAALDFCVTFEVSPPAWSTARCVYRQIDPEGVAITGSSDVEEFNNSSAPSSQSVQDGDTQMDTLNSQMGNLVSDELSGLIEGHAIAVLGQLEAKFRGADVIMISCALLIRVDFSAAGTLLNWVYARQAESRAVQFTDVNRLVAAFFNVIGISEHATVTIRRD